MKRPWDSRKLLRIVEIPRVDGVRACDEIIEYDYKIWLRYYKSFISRVVSVFILDFGLTYLFSRNISLRFFKILNIHKNGRFRESFQSLINLI